VLFRSLVETGCEDGKGRHWLKETV
jgi:hypothetical protein